MRLLLERLVEAPPRLVEQPAVVVAAQPALLHVAVRQVGAAVGAVAVDQAVAAAAVAVEDEVLAHDADRPGRGGIELGHARDRVPVAPQQLAHRRVRAGLAEQSVPFLTQHRPLLEEHGGMGADEWAGTGLDEIDIADAVGLRLTVREVLAWAPFRPLEIHWARRHGLSPAEARRWAACGVPIRDTVRALAVGLDLDELRRWEEHGFNASDAWEARETGVGIAEAVAWRDAGFVVPDALQLIRDRWTLDAAVVARNAGINRYRS
jgi:hypothetical protein